MKKILNLFLVFASALMLTSCFANPSYNEEEALKMKPIFFGDTRVDDEPVNSLTLIAPTLEGDMKAEKGCYIIRGVENEYYPCDAAIFNKTYEKL